MFNPFKYRFYIRRIKKDHMFILSSGVKHFDLNIRNPSLVLFISDIEETSIYNKIKTKKMFFRAFSDKEPTWVHFFPSTGLLRIGNKSMN